MLNHAIARVLPVVPRPVVRRISSRYIAGSELDDATHTVRALNARGKMATVDVLGEEITDARETDAIAAAYEEVLAEIDRRHLDSNISVKPTALVPPDRSVMTAPTPSASCIRRIAFR